MSDFYITLQSDSSSLLNEQNKTSNFRNYLASTIRVDHESYEVALVECTYTHSNNLIQKGEILYGFSLKNVEFKDTSRRQLDKETIINQQQYTATKDCQNIEELVEMLNKIAPESIFKIAQNGRIEFHPDFNQIKSALYKIVLQPKIAGILGYENTKEWLKYKHGNNNALIGYHRHYFQTGQSRLYVYANIIENQFIGNTMAPLLRQFNYTGEHEKITTKTFAQLQYINLATPEFDHIHMYIKTESGNPPPFTVGAFSATLHFRRKRY
jgi:hypothetical protein